MIAAEGLEGRGIPLLLDWGVFFGVRDSDVFVGVYFWGRWGVYLF